MKGSAKAPGMKWGVEPSLFVSEAVALLFLLVLHTFFRIYSIETAGFV